MTWQDEYRAALLRYVLDHGTPVRESGDTYYGYIAHDYRELFEHRQVCELTPSELREGSEDTFAGTFVGPETSYFIDVTVSCACGQINGRRWRYEGNLGEILLALLKEDTK